MLANPPKQSRPSMAECNALYYFPEIPCGVDTGGPAQSSAGRFVGMSPGRDQDDPAAYENLEDCPQVREMLEDAFRKGVDRGRAETAAAQQDTVANAAAALAKALEEVSRIRKQECRSMETEIVRLALAISRKIIGHAAEYGQIIESVVQAALRKVTDRRHLTVKLNPRDLDTVAAFKHTLQTDDDSDMLVDLESDESIGRGGCIIETRLGDVDARIDRQVSIVEAQLLDQLPPSTRGE